MAVLSPKALIELWNEMLNEGRKTGFGMKHSDAFIKKINDEYDQEFDNKNLRKVLKMAKKMSLPVAKAGGPVSTADAIEGPDRISIQERKYRAEDGARTLARAQEIKRDKGLMKDIKSHVKMMTKAVCK